MVIFDVMMRGKEFKADKFSYCQVFSASLSFSLESAQSK